MPDSNVLVRLPIAVFALACRKSIQTLTDWADVHPISTTATASFLHIPQTFAEQTDTSNLLLIFVYHLISRVGGGDLSTHRHGFNRFVFLNLPTLSLENHLGVTTSPQFPLSASYITPPVCSGSLSLRLMPPLNRRQLLRCESIQPP